MQPIKESLRNDLKKRRRALSKPETGQASQIITAKLIPSLDLSKAQKVHVYKANRRWNEIETNQIVLWLQHNFPEIKIVQPSSDKLQAMPDEMFDIIIVPVLGFDSRKYRLGLGGGYYDRFLTNQPHALKIGLAYEFGFVKAGIPKEPHDVRLDKIITEERIIT
jgi:5-formyltetrahydrofolate cyclo-ligase